MKKRSAISGPPKTYKRTKSTVVSKKKYTYKAPPTKTFIGRQPLPLQLFNTLKYVETRAMTPAVGFLTYQYSCNSLFDPNVTGTGHQPMYFDKLAGIYDHYTVLRARIKITPGVNSTQTSPQFAVIYIDDDTSVVSTIDQACEQKNASKLYTWLPASGNPPTLYSYWDAAKTFGPNPQAQDSLQGTSTTSPSEQSYFTFVLQDAATTSTAFTALVEIEYDCVWDELKTEPLS